MGIGITSFLEDCRSRGLTKHTIDTYRSNVSTYLDFVEDPLNADTPQLRNFLDDLRAQYLASHNSTELTMDNPLYDWDKRLESSIQLIKDDPQLPKHNKTQLLKFKRFLLVEKGLKPVRVVKYMSTLRIVLGWLGNKSCTDTDKEDLLCIVEKIDSNGFKDWTKHDYKVIIKVFWQWLGKDDLVSWIKLNKVHNSKLPEELLTPEELQDMVNVANNARDRALIAALYESNTRIGEFGSLQIKHIVFEIIQDTLTAVLIVNGKTGMRRIRIVQSAPDLQEWIRQHPGGDDPEAWVWVNLHAQNSSQPVKYATFRKVLKPKFDRFH